jgi:hypothetical protein
MNCLDIMSDNIYLKTNLSRMRVSAGILLSDISDHLPVLCLVTCEGNSCANKTTTFKTRKLTQNVYDEVGSILQETDWNILDNMSIDDAYTFFIHTLTTILNELAPVREIKIPTKYVIRDPWLTKGLLKSSRTRQKLYKKYILNKTNTTNLHEKYVKYRNLYNSLKRIAKQSYYKDLFIKFNFDSRNTWKVLNSIIGRENDKSVSNTRTFNINDTDTTENSIIVEKFGKFFSAIGPSYASQIPQSEHSPNHYLKVNKSRNSKSIFISPTDTEEIREILNNIKPKKIRGT